MSNLMQPQDNRAFKWHTMRLITHTSMRHSLVMAASAAPDLDRARWAIQHAAHIAEGAAQLAGGAAGGRPGQQAPQQARLPRGTAVWCTWQWAPLPAPSEARDRECLADVLLAGTPPHGTAVWCTWRRAPCPALSEARDRECLADALLEIT